MTTPSSSELLLKIFPRKTNLEAKNSREVFRGKIFSRSSLEEGVVMTIVMENQTIVDWLEAVGGMKLVKYIRQVFTDELKIDPILDL
jgi:hypothetical protein